MNVWSIICILKNEYIRGSKLQEVSNEHIFSFGTKFRVYQEEIFQKVQLFNGLKLGLVTIQLIKHFIV